MKYFWISIAVAGLGAGFLNAVYDDIPRGGRSMESVKRQCTKKFVGGGYDRAQSKMVCACMTRKAENWRAANPDGDYTRDIHSKFGATCINQVGLSPAKTRSRPRKLTAEEERLLERLNRGNTGAKKAPPSDWGGQDFVQDEGVWAE